MNRTLKTAEVAVLALIAVAGFLFTACSGDLHDEDESTRAAIIISIQDQTVTLPAGTDFSRTGGFQILQEHTVSCRLQAQKSL